jgi:hypothetical protein
LAPLTIVLCAALVAFSGCAQKKQSNVEQVRAAVRKTLATPSFTVTATTKSLGATVNSSKAEHDGSNGRVSVASVVRGIFVGQFVYEAEDSDPGVFVKCGRRAKDGSIRTFDTYSQLLRTAAKAKSVKRRGSVFVFEKLLHDSTGRTQVEFTIAGGRIKTMTLRTFPTGPNVSPPITVVFGFSYRRVPTITPPPRDDIEDVAAC